MSATERIPRATADKFGAITTLTDSFCAKQLNEEYRALIHRVVANLARKRPSPLLNGKEDVWAAAVVHAVGRVNFLDDPSQDPHCKPKILYEFFGVAESTAQNKSSEIRAVLRMGPMSPEWTLPSRLADNPLVWLLTPTHCPGRLKARGLLIPDGDSKTIGPANHHWVALEPHC
jgi:hypothetical protein